MSNVQAVNNGSSAQTAAETTASKQKSDILGKDAFLQLLVTQLRYQDPLSPMDNSQFISQMAQFTALEQSQNTTGQMQRLNALAMLGRTVTVQPSDGAEESVVGVVDRVVTEKGVTKVGVQDKLYTIDQVTSVT